MSTFVTELTEAGPIRQVTIDGTDVEFQESMDAPPEPIHSQYETASGRPVFTAFHPGDGYPDQTDRYQFTFSYKLTDEQSSSLEFLKKLRKKGGVHTLCIWMKEPVYWTAQIGETDFFFPRKNAPSVLSITDQGESDIPVTVRTSTDGGSNWTSLTVTMQATVSGTPSAGTCLVGRDRTLRIPSPGAETLIEAVYVPLYRVVIVQAPSEYNQIPFETITLSLVETTEE